MNTPPLLVAVALLFWGWQTGHWIIGAIAGAALESSRVIRFRWGLTQTDFNRLWNICCVLFLALAVALLINENTISLNDFVVNAGRRPEAIREAGKSALVWLQWLPMIFYPFVLAQAFNEKQSVGLAAFSWWLRKQEARDPNATLLRDSINVAFPYVAVCLLSASAVNDRARFFYYGMAAIVGWALWSNRTRRYATTTWAIAFLILAVAGFAGHAGLYLLQKKLEQLDVTWFSRFATASPDSKQAHTSIGSVGRLKLSDRIVLRVRTDGSAPPQLLREASYSIYRGPIWSNMRRDFYDVFPENEGLWKLLSRNNAQRTANIAQYLRRGAGLISLPTGTHEISELPAATVRTNFFGATRVEGAPGLVIYKVRYDAGATFDSGPEPDDLRLFDGSEPAGAQVAQELGLRDGMNPREAMKRVTAFFAEKFTYSTYLSRDHQATSNETALARFLLHTRSGHCEYFATATTLLLRYAGVPTRYAVGYSVQEGSTGKYVVRERHAHAWTLVWHDKAWHDFDTTPASWNAVESAHRSFLEPLKDFFSDVWFEFSKLRWGKTEWRKYFLWAPVPLLVAVIVRFFFGRHWTKTHARRKEQGRELDRAGTDSEFYQIEQQLAARGLGRSESENWSDWLVRIAEHEKAAVQLHRTLALHLRYRFDPHGLNVEDRAALRVQVAQWLGHG